MGVFRLGRQVCETFVVLETETGQFGKAICKPLVYTACLHNSNGR